MPELPKRKVKMCFDLHTVDERLAISRIGESGWFRAGDANDPPPNCYGHFADSKGNRAFLVDAGDYRGGRRMFLIVYEDVIIKGNVEQLDSSPKF